MSLDWLDLGVLCALLAVAGAGWLALTLAELGLFFGAAAAVACLAFGLVTALLVTRRLLASVIVVPPAPEALGVLFLLAVVAAVTLGRPHEYLLGGLDPGVYVDTAVHIARTGSIVVRDEDVAALSPAARAALFRERPGPFSEGSRFVGFYLAGVEQGRVVPHGMHLLPAAIAVGYGLGGLAGLAYVPPLLALVGVGVVGLLARRWAGGAAGALTALFLLTNPAEAWFGRYPAAELWVQVGLFGGLFALGLASAGGSAVLALLAGVLVGLCHLAKIDTFLVPVAVLAVAGYLWLARRLSRRHVWFLVGYALLLAQALAHVALISTQYAYSVYAGSLPSTVLMAALAALGAALVVGALALRRTGRAAALLDATERRAAALWPLAVAAFGLLALFGWYGRPMDPWHELVGLSDGAATVVRNRLQYLPRLGWFVPPLAVLLAFTGYCLALRRLRGLPAALLLVLLPLEAIVVFADPRITPAYPWAARRWVGLIVPGALMLASCQLVWLAGRLPTAPELWAAVSRLGWSRREPGAARQRVAAPGTRPSTASAARPPAGPAPNASVTFPAAVRVSARLAEPRLFLAAVAAVVVLVGSLAATWPLLGQRELAGSAALVDSLAAAVEPDAVVLFDDDLIGWRLSAPLELIGNRASFVLFGAAARDDAVRAPLDEWQGRGRPVYWLRAGRPAPLERWDRTWQPRDTWRTGLREVGQTFEAPPTGMAPFDVPITLYRAS